MLIRTKKVRGPRKPVMGRDDPGTLFGRFNRLSPLGVGLKILVFTRIFDLPKPHTLVLMVLLTFAGSIEAVSPTEAGGLRSHDPIVILGDSDFSPENGVTRGSGSVGDPYIIEGWNIDASKGPVVELNGITTSGQGILIVGTVSYFVIRNVRVHSGILAEDFIHKDGVSLKYLVNGRIENLEIVANSAGIEADWVGDTVIESNTFMANNVGIVLTSSYRNSVARNHILRGIIGIEVASDSRENVVRGNRVENQEEDGIFLIDTVFSASRNLFVGNLVRDSGRHGIHVISVSSDMFRGNLVSGSDVGFWMFWGAGMELSGNLVLSNRVGVQLIESPPHFPTPQPFPVNTVTQNRIISNEIGILSCASSIFNVLEPNLLKNNEMDLIRTPDCS